MPFKYYHGRTGVVFNITKRAIGVDVKKEVNGRILNKRIHVAVPHVNHSKCRDEIIRRKRENEATKAAARKGGGNLLIADELKCVAYIFYQSA
jgi:large subunit ribosomal protein L21e